MAKKKNKKGLFLKVIFIAFVVILSVSAIIVYSFYKKVYHPNVVLKQPDTYVYIPTSSDFNDVVQILNKEGLLINTSSFEWLAEEKQYINLVKPGRYRVRNNMNNNDLINLLRSGRQEPVNVVFNNVRTYEDLAAKASTNIEADSLDLILAFKNSDIYTKYGFNEKRFITMFLPNTYEFYWNTSAEEFIVRMAQEYKKFWNDDRKAKAAALNLSQSDVSILASIVEKESLKRDEQPRVAGVYINRLKKGMKLQADPTVIFAIGDFTINRVLFKHLEYDSPYNTYKYAGLPPGPICLPSISAINAVLNYEKHDYLFFCAREDFSGYHSFAKTLQQHNINARKYQNELNRRNIKR